MARTGVDIVTRSQDETGGFRSVLGGLRRIESAAGETGKKAGDKLSEGLIGGLSNVLAGQAIDRALRSMADRIRSGGTGVEIGIAVGESIAEGLKSVPIAGALGDLLTTTITDRLTGGTIAQELAQKSAQAEGARRQALEGRIAEQERRLADDKLSAEEKRRKELEQQIAPLIREAGGLGDSRAVGDRLRQAVDERLKREQEARDADARRKRAEEEQRAAEQRAKEATDQEQRRQAEAEKSRQQFERINEQLQRDAELADEQQRRDQESRSRALEGAAGRGAPLLESRELRGDFQAFQQTARRSEKIGERQLVTLEQLLRAVQDGLGNVAIARV